MVIRILTPALYCQTLSISSLPVQTLKTNICIYMHSFNIFLRSGMQILTFESTTVLANCKRRVKFMVMHAWLSFIYTLPNSKIFNRCENRCFNCLLLFYRAKWYYIHIIKQICVVFVSVCHTVIKIIPCPILYLAYNMCHITCVMQPCCPTAMLHETMWYVTIRHKVWDLIALDRVAGSKVAYSHTALLCSTKPCSMRPCSKETIYSFRPYEVIWDHVIWDHR